MPRLRRPMHLLALVAILASLLTSVPVSRAEPVANDPFLKTWNRIDKPVSDGAVIRTWMWGPAAFTADMPEDYAESPNGQRTVQYFDKSRMEITTPDGDQASEWYVTNGLLVMELVTGRMQTGDSAFVERNPAQVNVAGDANDANGPTYVTIAGLRDDAAFAEGTLITQRVNRAGAVSDDASLAGRGVTASHYVTDTKHTVASPFWAFMQSSGTVWEDGGTTNAPLFSNPFYATGYPIAEAYWASVQVGGTARDVLLQCFERRCLTYTPDNPVEWQVEAGNVGQHYYAWRYPDAPEGPSADANALATALTTAGSDEAREAALLDVMRALGIGVYSNSGAQIVGGAERGAGDFYLYELELELMAKAFGHDGTTLAATDPVSTLGVEDLALALTNLPILAGGATVNAELLRQVIIDGVRESAAEPDEDSSLGPLVVRQLGLASATPYDLLLDVPIEQLRFDPLQSFLILSDILLPIVAETGPVEVGSTNLEAQTRGILKLADAEVTALADENPCEADIGTGTKEAWSGGKWFAGFIKKIGTPVKLAAVAIDGIHGSMLAYSVLVYSLDQTLATHYGHDAAGEAMNFRVKVEMVDELPENLVKCGWMLGVEFPKKGPIKDVVMVWSEGHLADHGTIVCGDTCKKTAVDGIATLIFEPLQESNPGAGWLVEDRGTVTGFAMYQSRHKNVLGSLNQIIVPKSGATAWKVEYHQIPAYTVTMELAYDAELGYPNGDDHFWTHIGSGEITYIVTIPASMVHYPREAGDTTFVATGSGNGVTMNPEACPVSFDGTWSKRIHLELADAPEAPGEFSRFVRVYPTAPPYTMQNSSCLPGSADFSVFYGALSAPPLFDLTVREPQEFTVSNQTLCPIWLTGTSGTGSLCETNAEWTITVEFAAPVGQQ